ncbi:MAG: carbohydrate ABC transporter permease [Anaerolineae bacterium]
MGSSTLRSADAAPGHPRSLLAAWFQSRRNTTLLARVGLYLVLTAGSLVFILPFFYMLNMAVSSPAGLAKFPLEWLPKPVMLTNFTEGWTYYMDFTRYLQNTLQISISATLGTVLSCILVAYSFARISWPGRSFWFVLLLGTMMLPGQVTLVPTYVIFAKLKWVNTYNPLIVPSFFGSAFYIFLLRQFFMTLPRDLDDAARIDGCGYLGTLTRVLLPVCKPPIVAVLVFSFVSNWSDFFGPLIYINDPDKYTLVLGITSLTTSAGITYIHMGYVMAVNTLIVLPILAIYFWAQRYFIEGITLTGVRG